MLSPEEEQTRWYARYYGQTNSSRNDLRTNKGVLFQSLAWEASFVRASYHLHHDVATAKILDVGCGGGNSLDIFRRLGYRPENYTGIDIQTERLAAASSVYPQVRFLIGDATDMEFASGEFDIVFESTMFATLAEPDKRAQISREMLRVCKPGGFLILMDWRYRKPFNSMYGVLANRDVRKLFRLGIDSDLITVQRGALVPPLGRALSRWLSPLYFLLTAVAPFCVGQVAYVVRKRG
jgi:ubiquinone/menaquinone biosynthesis C-methylase UbiE